RSLKETMTVAGTATAFIFVTAGDGGPLELARYSGVSRDALRVVLSAPGFRRFTPPQGIKVVADVSADPALSPLAHNLHGSALALLPLRTEDGRQAGKQGVALEDVHDPAVRGIL